MSAKQEVKRIETALKRAGYKPAKLRRGKPVSTGFAVEYDQETHAILVFWYLLSNRINPGAMPHVLEVFKNALRETISYKMEVHMKNCSTLSPHVHVYLT